MLYFCGIDIIMTIKYLFLGILILALTGCVKASFYPDILPHACLNQPYETKIAIDGGTVVSSDWKKYGQVSDKNFKIHPRVYFSEHRDIYGNLVPKYDGNELTLSGTPTSLEPIDVKIGVDFYKHMFQFQELWFEKQYQLVVKNCD